MQSLLKKDLNKKNEKSNTGIEDSSVKKRTHKSHIIELVVFVFSISIVLLSLVSVIFPALIASNSSTIKELTELGIVVAEINPFATGIWTAPLLATNLIILGLGIFYFKKKLPESLKKLFDFVLIFEISKKTAIIAVGIILVFFAIVSAGDLFEVEDWEDYPGVIERLESWSPEQIGGGIEPHVRYFLLWSSMKLFGFYTIIPFIASLSLLVLTYFFTVTITKKRFAGIIAMLILAQSSIFLEYDSTVSYTNFWILFYLLSLFLIYKVWPLSPFSYLFAILSKALSGMFFPMSLFFIYRSNISKTKKILLLASTTIIILIGIIAILSGANLGGITGSQEQFNSNEFWMGFASFSYQLRFDGLVILFILPLIVGLFLASRKGVMHADSIMFLIGGILFTAPLLTGFTEQTNQPYRFVSLIVFFAIGVGVLLSKRKF